MNKRLNNKTTGSKGRKQVTSADVGELIRTGYALQTQNRTDEAIKCFEQVLRAEPGNPDAVHLTSLALMKQNRFTDALGFLRKWAAHAKSNNVATQYYIGYGYYVLKRYKLALEHLDKALAFEPGKAITRLLIARVLIGSGKPGSALEFLQQGPAIASRLPEDMVSYGDILTQLEQYQASKKVHMDLLQSGSFPVERLYDLILLPPETWSPEICEQVSEYQRKSDLTERQKSLLHFSAGRIADHQARFHDAFRCFGNAKKLSARPFNFDTYRKTLRVSQGAPATPAHKPAVRPTKNPDVTPVFVLGLPRSGKSILENLLALRPELAACGEIPPRLFIDADIFIDSKGKVPENYENRLAKLKSTQCAMYAGDYVRGISDQFSLPETTRYIMNTLPHNYLNIRPLRRIFPASKFIFVSREKNDLFVFNYMKNFTNQYSFTRDFESFTQYYDLIEDQLPHWQENLGSDFLNVSYADIVTSPEDTLTQVYKFLVIDVSPDAVAALKFDTTGLTDEYIGYWKNYRDLLPQTATGARTSREPLQ